MSEIARARYRYDAGQPGDLSFEADEIIRILEKPDTGWWVGQLDDGTKGEFPYNFVEIISEEERAAIVNTRRITTEGRYNRGKSDAHRVKDVVIQVKQHTFEIILKVLGGPNIAGKRRMSEFRKLDHTCHALIKNFDSILPPAWADNLELSRELNQERGQVLTKYLRKLLGVELIEYAIVMWLDPSAKYKAKGDIKAEYAKKSGQKGGVYRNDVELTIKNAPSLARVLYNWIPQDDVELPLEKGSIIAIIKRHTQSKGWWEGETANGERGLFPYNYVEILSDNEARAVVLGKPLDTGNESGNALTALSPKHHIKKAAPKATVPSPTGLGKRQQKSESNFFIKTHESFEKLLQFGYTLEHNNKLLKLDDSKSKPQSGDRCELSYCTYVWNCQTQQIIEVASSEIPDSKGKLGPLVFNMDEGQVVKGIEEGTKKLFRGQSARLIVSPRLGYGKVGNPRENIPPNAFLIYDLTLESFGAGGGERKGGLEGKRAAGKRGGPASPRGKRPPQQRQKASPPGGRGQRPPGSPRMQNLAEAVARENGKQPQPNYKGPIQERPRRRPRRRERYKAPADPGQVKKYKLFQLQEIVMKGDFKKAHVNPSNIEDYLEDRDFENTFGMPRDNFMLLPHWQQANMLKRAKLQPR